MTIQQIFTILPPKALLGFMVSFLIFTYCMILKKWEGLYVALPGMFISALAIAVYVFGNIL